MKKATSTPRRLLRLAAIGFLSMFVLTTVLGYVATAQEPPAAEQIDGAPADPGATDGDEAAGEAAAEDSETLTLGGETGTPVTSRLASFLGVFGLIGIAWLLSANRRAVDWKLVGIGTAVQLGFALLILKTDAGREVFAVMGGVFEKLLQFTEAGNAMIFMSYTDGSIHSALNNFAFAILPTIIFFSSLMTILYHVGVMQRVVNVIAWAMQRTMGTSGSETLSAAGNIFVGQTEAPLLVKPFVPTMTKSELMAVMTGGFATVAGGVMAAYISFLKPYFGNAAGHLMAASVMSAPAALVMAKIMFPETEQSPTQGVVKMQVEKTDANVIDAAARGATEGLSLAFNVAAMLLAFVALIAMFNYMFALPSYMQHAYALDSLVEQIAAAGGTIPAELRATCDPSFMLDTGEYVRVATDLREGCIDSITAAVPNAPSVNVARVFSLEFIFGILFAPVAFIMGVPWSEARLVGELLGTKMVVNEFVGYLRLAEIMGGDNPLSPRSAIIATYALCGFANFGSIGIQIGGISALAPERRSDLAKLGLRAMIAGSLAAFMTATIAGILL